MRLDTYATDRKVNEMNEYDKAMANENRIRKLQEECFKPLLTVSRINMASQIGIMMALFGLLWAVA